MHVEYGDIDSEYMFINLWAGRLGATRRRQLMARIAARTGVDFTAHMLRHSRATDLIRRGVPIEVVARLLTHRSSTTTSQTYIRLDAADVREALYRAGAWERTGPSDEPLGGRGINRARDLHVRPLSGVVEARERELVAAEADVAGVVWA